jgi:SLT domain-containing protein
VTGIGGGSAPPPTSSKIQSSGFTTGEVSHGQNVRLGKRMASALGWGKGQQWQALNQLWTRESNWRNTAQNPSSTAYGIAQFLDSTWKGTGYKKSSNPVIQISAGLLYIKHRYGSPLAAWQHETQYGWY